MKTTDLFKSNRSAKRINESMEKMFGTKLDLANFDLPKLEDARNKIRTQLSQVRGQSGFNENIENEAVAQAQWMLDAINSEIAERQEFIADPHQAEFTEESDGSESETMRQIASGKLDAYDVLNNPQGPDQEAAAKIMQQMYDDISIDNRLHPDDDFEEILDRVVDRIADDYGYDDDEGGETDDAYALSSAGFGSDEDYGHYGESAPPTAKGERMVKHIKKGYAKDGKLTDKEKSIAYATAWKQHNKEKNESIESGDNMTRKLTEGEIQQAQSIVTAKTMVDRVGRWIEELSGMENDTLLQLGDQIRDEMSAEQAKSFISQCAPAIQQALQNLKDTRETLATGVRMLTGEEQGAEMLGGEPGPDLGGDELGAAEPDMMNAGDEGDIEFGPPEDEFGASEANAG